LQKIAARELGDASLWRDLISINSLDYPYLTGDPTAVTANVKLYGSQIAVPSASNRTNAQIDPNAVFGVDMKLDGGLLLDNGIGDFVVVAGRDNYKQAIENRIATRRKELTFHQTYGCDIPTLLGTVTGPTATLLAAQYAKEAVLADDRTQAVTTAVAKTVGDVTAVNVVAVPVAGAPVAVSNNF
ncbi:MAG TPA: hypothetical protein DEQ40_08470, partial [Oxalobacteraceae bacterium]|nr:hypothetical protein [Oxalobacteraceae bacterium]